jgi:hypothetical protein
MISRRTLKTAALVPAAVALAIQFIPVDRTNPPAVSSAAVPQDVEAILEGACFDCHSHRTVWPWYSRIAPVSWLVVHDVTEGREHLNLSTWGELEPKKQDRLREEMWEEVEDGEMPLPAYRLTHPVARLTDADRELLRRWSGSGDRHD